MEIRGCPAHIPSIRKRHHRLLRARASTQGHIDLACGSGGFLIGLYVRAMMETQDIKTAILREIEAAGGDHRYVDMTLVGPPLVAAGYEVDRVAYAIDALLRDRLIERGGSNVVRIIKTRTKPGFTK